MALEANVFTDGGSRGNPGPAGIGVVLEFDGKRQQYCEFIGEKRTNNEAEYESLIFALKKLKSLLGIKKAKKIEVICHSDSELMVKQLSHEYKLKDPKIQAYFIQIWNLTLDFGKVSFLHIPRQRNKLADKLANSAMDNHEKSILNCLNNSEKCPEACCKNRINEQLN